MDNDRLPPIPYDSLFRTCVHEACHALRAHHVDWQVHWLRATGPHNGSIGVQYPLAAGEVEAAYTRDPEGTRRTVVEILTVLGAPGQVLGEALDGSDLEDQLAFRYAWEKTQTSVPWVLLRHQAQEQLRTWASTPGRVRQILSLGTLLEQRRYLSAGAFQAFITPPQAKWPALPVVPRQPAPAPSRPAPRQAPRSRGAVDLNRLVENIACLLPSLSDWRRTRHAGAGLLQSW
jgi:hypothetical protein